MQGSSVFQLSRKHHTSCCFKTGYPTKTNISQPANSSTALTPSSKNKGKPRPKTQPASAINNQEEHDQGATVLHNKETVKPVAELQPRDGNPETFLPVGKLTAVDPVTRKLKEIAVLLESGAEFSFIDSDWHSSYTYPY
ncbi:unnamed protein product [Haemonchus placei]|uniref:Reverse transcriptase domain-containing protein n=1 Tax=Haemonchus placei TaxID=6290 RepID=A0A0N4WVY4_HAEPC|nr:unnamed protein product [Haemonchus placei]